MKLLKLKINNNKNALIIIKLECLQFFVRSSHYKIVNKAISTKFFIDYLHSKHILQVYETIPLFR